ncbi:MAG: hypothetical protein ACLFPR_16210, partial [Desulfococcaceae bacterium]
VNGREDRPGQRKMAGTGGAKPPAGSSKRPLPHFPERKLAPRKKKEGNVVGPNELLHLDNGGRRDEHDDEFEKY